MASLTQEQKFEFIRNLPMFSGADNKVLLELADSMSENEALKGSIVIRKGDEADAVFIIAGGRVRVHDGNHVLARLEQGQMFGEYSLIDQRQRSASVTAEDNCRLLRLDNRDFYRIAAGDPGILRGVLKELINRMRDMNELEEKLSRSYLKIQRQKELIEKQNASIMQQKAMLEQQNFDLTKLNEEKNQLIGTVIHQIKNPLTSSLCMADMLDARDGFVDETEREGLAIIRNSIKRINNLINEILDINAIESKVYELKMEPLNVREILEDLIRNYSYFIDQKHINFKVQMVDITARLNRVYVTQIFDNLLSNAIKFTPDGKTIEVRLGENEDKIMFCVCDEGPGMEKEKMEKVFDHYKRQTSMFDQESAGNGLGLAIVYKYATAMHGTVRCESEPGSGTRFHVELPGMEKTKGNKE